MAFVLAMLPLSTRVPVPDWVKFCVLPEAAPRMTFALIVFVPLVMALLIAEVAAVVPARCSVRLAALEPDRV